MKIVKANDILKSTGISALVYAESGVGKTTMLSALPGRTLIVDYEAGTSVLADADHKNVDIVKIETDLSNHEEVMKELKLGKNEYNNICFDSITALEANMLSLFASESSSMMPTLNDYGKLNSILAQTLLDMRNIKFQGKNVVITALELPFDEHQIDGSVITKIYPFVKASKGTMAKKVVAEVDIVGRLEISQKEGSEGKRFVRLSKTGLIVAKDRIFKRVFCEPKNIFKKEGK